MKFVDEIIVLYSGLVIDWGIFFEFKKKEVLIEILDF